MCRPMSVRRYPGAAATARGCSRRELRTDVGRRPPRGGEAGNHRSSFVELRRWTLCFLLSSLLTGQGKRCAWRRREELPAINTAGHATLERQLDAAIHPCIVGYTRGGPLHPQLEREESPNA